MELPARYFCRSPTGQLQGQQPRTTNHQRFTGAFNPGMSPGGGAVTGTSPVAPCSWWVFPLWLLLGLFVLTPAFVLPPQPKPKAPKASSPALWLPS